MLSHSRRPSVSAWPNAMRAEESMVMATIPVLCSGNKRQLAADRRLTGSLFWWRQVARKAQRRSQELLARRAASPDPVTRFDTST